MSDSNLNLPPILQPERAWAVRRAILQSQRDASLLWSIWANRWLTGLDRHEAAIAAILPESATPEQAEATRLALALARGELPPSAPSVDDEPLVREERDLTARIVAAAHAIAQGLSPELIASQSWEGDAVVIGHVSVPVELAVIAILETDKTLAPVRVPPAYRPECSWQVLRAILRGEASSEPNLWHAWAQRWRSGYERHESIIQAILLESQTPEQAEATRLALALARGELPPSAPSVDDEILLRAERMLNDRIIAVARDVCRALSPEELRQISIDERGAIIIGAYAIPIELAVAAAIETS